MTPFLVHSVRLHSPRSQGASIVAQSSLAIPQRIRSLVQEPHDDAGAMPQSDLNSV
jgi:hypothetical protein